MNDADPGQFDQRLADRRVADAEALCQSLCDQPFAGSQPALEDIGEYGTHHCLAAQAVVEGGISGDGSRLHSVARSEFGGKSSLSQCRVEWQGDSVECEGNCGSMESLPHHRLTFQIP